MDVEAHLLSVPSQVNELSSDTSPSTSEYTAQPDNFACTLSLNANIACPVIPCIDRAEKHAAVGWLCSLSADEVCVSLDDDDNSASTLVATSLRDTSSRISPTLAIVVEMCSFGQHGSCDSRHYAPNSWLMGIIRSFSWNFLLYSTIIYSAGKHFVINWPTFLGAPFVGSGNYVRNFEITRKSKFVRHALAWLQMSWFLFCRVTFDLGIDVGE